MSSELSVGELETTQASSIVRWKIPNFSSIDATVGVKILSPDFETTHPHSTKLPWRLQLYPSGTEEENKEYMALYLNYLGSFQVTVSYSFSIVSEKHGEMSEFTPEKETPYGKRLKSRGTNKFCLRATIFDKAKKALINDTLVISCTIISKNTALNVGHNDEDASVKAHFKTLLERGDLSDVTFEIGTEQMHLHKAIISSLSPVFLAMFQHQMKEKEESVVRILDVKYEVMKELFRYIYVRKVNGIRGIATDLLVAADKYDVQGLKRLCEDILSQSLDVDNALKLLEFALKYNTTFLKLKVIEFVMGRLKEFVDKPEFVQMDGVCKDELLRAMAKQN